MTDETTHTTETDRPSRRGFLASGAAATTALVAGCLGSDDDAIESQFDAFVETDGTEFVVDGEPAYFNGTNNFWLTDPFADRELVDERLGQFAEQGFNFVRTWAFCEGQYAPEEEGDCLQPEPGVADQDAFEHLDYVIAKAGEHGIRLVLALTDYWDHYGGIPKYAEWAGLDGPDAFYTDDTAQEMYRAYVEYVLTRENTYTGLEYREDPTIMLWELANEPRYESGNGDVLGQWFEESAAYVKDIDDNHLVSTGMEGFYDRGGDHWVESGAGGTDYVEHHRIDDIDACTFHAYPNSWGLSRERAAEWMREHVVDAHEAVGKPVYAGEFNWRAFRDTDAVDWDQVDRDREDVEWEAERQERDAVLEEWYDVLDEHDCNAASIWQIVGPDRDDHDGYNVRLDDEPTMEVVDAFTEAQREKSATEW